MSNIRCSVCREYHPASEYRKGYRKCRACRNTITRNWYQKNKAKVRAKEHQKHNIELRRNEFGGIDNDCVLSALRDAYRQVAKGNIFQFDNIMIKE